MGDVVTPLVILGMLIVGIIWGITAWASDDSIKSNRPITPEIKLVIENNQVDTIYVYRRP